MNNTPGRNIIDMLKFPVYKINSTSYKTKLIYNFGLQFLPK